MNKESFYNTPPRPFAGFALYQLAETGSSNDDCLALPNDLALDGTIVLADHQSAGRGRSGRVWLGEREDSLLFSLLLRPTEVEQTFMGRFTALASLSLCELLLEQGAEVAVKWPNDLLLNGKKVCGILSECIWQGDQAERVVIGCGVNLGRGAFAGLQDARYPATSIEAEMGERPDRLTFLASFLRLLTEKRKKMGTPDFIREWNARLAFRGDWAPVRLDSGELQKLKVLGVQEDASLMVEDEGGLLGHLHSAELCPPTAN